MRDVEPEWCWKLYLTQHTLYASKKGRATEMGVWSVHGKCRQIANFGFKYLQLRENQEYQKTSEI